MSLLGEGAMTMWHDVKSGMEADHDDWHSHEHIPERIGIPGFRRGRRCRSIDGSPGWFLMYEVDDLSVLPSPAYLERLNSPSDWSQQIIPSITNMNRTLSRVESSHGVGVGGFLATIRFAAVAEARFDAKFPELAQAKGLVGAHFLRGDESASRINTKEKSLRDRPDEVSSAIILIEGYDADSVAVAAKGLTGRIAADEVLVNLYQLNHLIAEADLVS